MKRASKMSFDAIIQIIGILVVPVVGFLFKEVSATKKDLADYKKEAAEKYASRAEFIRLEDKIDNLSRLIMDRLPKRASR